MINSVEQLADAAQQLARQLLSNPTADDVCSLLRRARQHVEDRERRKEVRRRLSRRRWGLQ